MAAPAIPQRIPPLTWRKPVFIWTPLSLALAIGWPAALFYTDTGPQRLALIAGAAVFAVALITLGAMWAVGRAPRSRRIVVLHVVVAGAITMLSAPIVVGEIMTFVADSTERAGTLTVGMSLAMIPLAIVVGLPITLVSGIVFAWVALARQRPHELLDDGVFREDVQPFR
jgi:hypothetical protein